MNADIAKLRQNMFDAIAPYPKDCIGFDGRRLMSGTAFFPAGDGLWKGNGNIDPSLPVGGVLFLGSDWGDNDSYDGCGEGEANGKTWQGLLKLLDLAEIPRNEIFCTNAWPCLRAGRRAVGGVVPGYKDPEFTSRCKAFFLRTLELLRPKLVVPLGTKPTSFIASLTAAEPSPWGKARYWREIDPTPVWPCRDFNVVPIVHPSMPNHRYRLIVKSIQAEAALIRSVLAG
ncbi:MAG: uracil-DNA glycosylase family protein [Aliidongia sp.]